MPRVTPPPVHPRAGGALLGSPSRGDGCCTVTRERALTTLINARHTATPADLQDVGGCKDKVGDKPRPDRVATLGRKSRSVHCAEHSLGLGSPRGWQL